MNKQELEQMLVDEYDFLAQYERELVTAEAELMEEYSRDEKYGNGHSEQELASYQRQDKLQRTVRQCKQSVASQKDVIANLEQQLITLNLY
ncbi:TPA: hypothetical protein QHL53_003414 [Proteus mirabilis]|nr:hypothetical protein [Proteus mirabilis]